MLVGWSLTGDTGDPIEDPVNLKSELGAMPK